MTDILKAALYYQKIGLSVIPVDRSKKPKIKWEPFQKSRADETMIRSWYKKWPNANVGIVTGEISGITVLDADSEDAFNLLNEYLPDSFSTPAVKTPKGKHLYFRYTPEFSNAVRLVSEIDIRNNGGYVVAPPSTNGHGNKYAWFESLGIHQVKSEKMPSMLFDILLQSNSNIINNTRIYSSSSVQNASNIEQHECNISNILEKGRRDNDLFRLANCLIRGGMKQDEVTTYLKYIAKTCDPPFSEKDAEIKVGSAIKRSLDRDKISTQKIRDWVLATSGNFSVTNLYHEATLATSEAKAKARVILGRLVNEGIIEKFGTKDGIYRKVEDHSKKIDLRKITDSEFPMTLPLDLHELVNIQPKNVIVVAGERNAGKSCFGLNVARMNLNRGFNVRYLTSEMGGAELKSRLLKFEPEVPFDFWHDMEFRDCSHTFENALDPDGLNIIDYLKLEGEFHLIGGAIKRIFDKLNNGVVIIALQKKDRESLGVGGQFTKDEARLYVTLSANPPEGGIARIEKAKNWRREDLNPNYRECNFKIYKGTHIQMIGDWVDAWKGDKK